jgi:HNH endonuclease
MSVTKISPALREIIRQRAGRRCEYCLIAEDQAFLPFEVDHIISEKHGGETSEENLAWSCFDCNRFKGSDIASKDLVTGNLAPLFNPREEKWKDHFQIVGGEIIPLTSIGRVTILVLRINLPQRAEVRAILAGLGLYP